MWMIWYCRPQTLPASWGQAAGGAAGVVTAVKCSAKCAAAYAAEVAVCQKYSPSVEACIELAGEKKLKCEIRCGLYGLACGLAGEGADALGKAATTPRDCRTTWRPKRWLKPGVWCQSYSITCKTGQRFECSHCWKKNDDGSISDYDPNGNAPECTQMQ